MHPVVPSGGGYAPPPVVPVYAPGQLQPQQPQQKVKRSPSLPSKPGFLSSKPAAPQVTTLLVTKTVPPSANGTAASLGVIGGMYV